MYKPKWRKYLITEVQKDIQKLDRNVGLFLCPKILETSKVFRKEKIEILNSSVADLGLAGDC